MIGWSLGHLHKTCDYISRPAPEKFTCRRRADYKIFCGSLLTLAEYYKGGYYCMMKFHIQEITLNGEL